MSKLVRLEDGTFELDGVPCKTWIETSKKNDKHPEGKPWIVLPKGNATNRQYFSLELFEATNVDGEVEVEVKTSAPRVLGTSGINKNIIKYLDEATADEYTSLVDGAIAAYKEAKASTRKKKPEEMTEEELLAYIEALKSGKSIKAATTGPKSFLEMFSEEEYTRYNEIVALAQENKANMPRAKRGPLTDEEKAARKIKRNNSMISKAEALLAALKADTGIDDIDDGDIADDND